MKDVKDCGDYYKYEITGLTVIRRKRDNEVVTRYVVLNLDT